MTTFLNTLNPTPFGFFDGDAAFQSEADSMVTFVKRKLGDDILSVELTKKQIWSCFEESMCEYSSLINQYQIKSQLANLLGFETGSLEGYEQRFPRENLEFMLRRAEPYAMEAGLGGSYNAVSGSIQLVKNQQDYDIYDNLKDSAGDLIFSSSLNTSATKMKIMEVFHFSGQAAYRFFDSTSAMNYLNNEFSFESFTPETVFYVLPVFEDVLRGGQMDMSNRVRRSNYSYKIIGKNIRIFPRPSQSDPKKLWIRVQFSPDPMNPGIADPGIYGVSNMSNVPFGNLQFIKINSVGRQWVRQYVMALSKELLGLIRSKFASVPIPGGDLQLNGADLISQGREEKEHLRTKLSEMLESLTYSAMLQDEATAADSLTNILKKIPIPNGKAIFIG
jgi:hypothetical protein|tara:strand:+ start:1383 stop:2552 length:1170 start_codon:yes stop_codon:yes gene_type:complete